MRNIKRLPAAELNFIIVNTQTRIDAFEIAAKENKPEFKTNYNNLERVLITAEILQRTAINELCCRTMYWLN